MAWSDGVKTNGATGLAMHTTAKCGRSLVSISTCFSIIELTAHDTRKSSFLALKRESMGSDRLFLVDLGKLHA